MQKKTWKRLGNAVFVFLVFLLTLWSVFHGENLGEMITCLKMADKVWLVPGVACVLLFVIGESVIIYYLLRTLGSRVQFSHCCLYSFIGFFYSCITPSASGGQPMQVVAMRKDKIPIAVSTVILAIIVITYKLVLVVIGAAVLLLRPASLMPHLDGVKAIIYLGMTLNIIFIVCTFLLVFHPTLVRVFAEKLLHLLHRIRPFHNFDKQRVWLDGLISQYYGTAEFYRTHKMVILNVFLITAMQRFALFAVTWITYRAFHLRGYSFWVLTLLQALIALAADMMPLPGGMGVSENLFLIIFAAVFGEKLILPGMVVSRGLSFYTQVLICGLMTAAAAFIIKEKK